MAQERLKRGDLIRFEDPVIPGHWEHGQVVRVKKDIIECVIEESFRDHGHNIVSNSKKLIVKAGDDRLHKLPDPGLH